MDITGFKIVVCLSVHCACLICNIKKKFGSYSANVHIIFLDTARECVYDIFGTPGIRALLTVALTRRSCF